MPITQHPYAAPVAQLFLSFFNRAAEFGALTYYVQRLEAMLEDLGADATLGDALKALAREIYYTGTSNGEIPSTDVYTDAHYVLDIYQNVLGRSVADDPAGWNYWVRLLESGQIAREDMMITILYVARDAERDGEYLANRTLVALEFAREDRSGPELLEHLTINASQILEGVDERPESVSLALERLEQSLSQPEPGQPSPGESPGPTPGGNDDTDGGKDPQPPNGPEPVTPTLTLSQALTLPELPDVYLIDPAGPLQQLELSLHVAWSTVQRVETILAGAENHELLDLGDLYVWGVWDNSATLVEALSHPDLRPILDGAKSVYMTNLTSNWYVYQSLSQLPAFDLGYTELVYPTVLLVHAISRTESDGPYYLDAHKTTYGFTLQELEADFPRYQEAFLKAINADNLNFEDIFDWAIYDIVENIVKVVIENPENSFLISASGVYIEDEYIRKSDFEVIKSLENLQLGLSTLIVPEIALHELDSLDLVGESWSSFRQGKLLLQVEEGLDYAVKISIPGGEGISDAVDYFYWDIRDSLDYHHPEFSIISDVDGSSYLSFTAPVSGELIVHAQSKMLLPDGLVALEFELRKLDEIVPSKPEEPEEPGNPWVPGEPIELNLDEHIYLGSDDYDDVFYADIQHGQQTLRDTVVIDGGWGDDRLEAWLTSDYIGEYWALPDISSIERIDLHLSDEAVVNLDFQYVQGAESLYLFGDGYGDYQGILGGLGEISKFYFDLYDGSHVVLNDVENGSVFIETSWGRTLSLELSPTPEYVPENLKIKHDAGWLFLTGSNSQAFTQFSHLEIHSRGERFNDAIISFDNYPGDFAQNFNISSISLDTDHDLTLGVIRLGLGMSTIAGVEDRHFASLNAESSTGNIVLDVMLELRSNSDQAWEVRLGSGNDTVNVLNSRVNGLAFPLEGISLSGGDGDDTLRLNPEVYTSWLEASPADAKIEGFEILHLDGMLLDGTELKGDLFGNAFKEVSLSGFHGLNLSIDISGDVGFRVGSAKGVHFDLSNEVGPDSSYLAIDAETSYRDFLGYQNNKDYYGSNYFAKVVSSSSELNLWVAQEYYYYSGYIIEGGGDLSIINFRLDSSRESQDVRNPSKIAAVLEDTQIREIYYDDVDIGLLDLTGNQNGVHVYLPDQFIVLGSQYDDIFVVNVLSAIDNRNPVHLPTDDAIAGRVIQKFDSSDQLMLDPANIASVRDLDVAAPIGGDANDVMVEALALLGANEAGWYEHDGNSYVVGKGDSYSQAEYQGVQYYQDLLFLKLESFSELSLSNFVGFDVWSDISV